MSSTSELDQNHPFLKTPQDVQVRILTYLRAYELASVQQTCRYFNQPKMIHALVSHASEQVYPSGLTLGFAEQAVQSDTRDNASGMYTLEHLRNMELLVIARVLNSPEPSTGFIVSKSWCKSALKWLEATNSAPEKPKSKKKVSKKKERMRARKLSDVNPPWPNVNADLLCEHLCLSRCSNGKSARARRRYVNKHSWKILKKLYPDSTSLEAVNGECLQCFTESEMAKKTQRDAEETLKLERKQPLSNPALRRLYTRRTGMPAQCLRKHAPDDSEQKLSATCCCPLVDGDYYVLPREWCHRWRKYMKTGEGGQCGAPDASPLVCDAHKLLLLPPHLESFLQGSSPQLLASNDSTMVEQIEPIFTTGSVPGLPPDRSTVQAMLEAGLSNEQVGQQLSALRFHEQQRLQQHAILDNIDAPLALSTPSKNELLDRENHAVAEIVSRDEYKSLEACWPPGSSFGLRLKIHEGRDVWCTQACRDCDATGKSHDFQVKNRARSRVKKSAEKARAPASLEY